MSESAELKVSLCRIKAKDGQDLIRIEQRLDSMFSNWILLRESEFLDLVKQYDKLGNTCPMPERSST